MFVKDVSFQVVLMSLMFVHVSDQFGLNQLFDDIKTGWDVMIDSWGWLLIGQVGVYMASPVLDDSTDE